MMCYVKGPPPRAMLEPQNENKGRWRGAGDMAKWFLVSFKDNDREPLDPFTCHPDTWWFVNSSLELRNERALFGGRPRRSVLVRPSLNPPRVDQIRTWDFVLGPVRAWEAWDLADHRGFSMQGIEYMSPSNHLRIWRENDDDQGICIDDIENRVSILGQVELYIDKGQRWIDSEIDRIRAVSGFADTDEVLELLVAVDAVFVPTYHLNRGWSLCDVWRMSDEDIEAQAEIMGETAQKLRKRMERRQLAAERHGNG